MHHLRPLPTPMPGTQLAVVGSASPTILGWFGGWVWVWVGCRVSSAPAAVSLLERHSCTASPRHMRHGVLCCRLQVRPDGAEIECLSEDGRYCKAVEDCTNFARCLAAHPTIVMPGGVKTLACGEQHKQLHGFTNYELISTWCTQLAIAAGEVAGANTFELALRLGTKANRISISPTTSPLVLAAAAAAIPAQHPFILSVR